MIGNTDLGFFYVMYENKRSRRLQLQTFMILVLRSSRLSFQTYTLGPVIIDIEFFRISC